MFFYYTQTFWRKFRYIVVTPIHPSIRKKSCHLNSNYILTDIQFIFNDLIGYILQMHNKLGFNFGIFLLHLRSIKGKWCVWWCCHWNSVYDFWGRTMILQGKSNRYAIRFPNLHVIPKSQTNVERWHFLFSVKLVTLPSITFSRVHNWYSKTWLHMSCSCAESIRNFYFTHCGHMRAKQWRFLPYKASYLNSIFISNVKQMIQWYDLVCLVNLRGKLSMESIKGRNFFLKNSILTWTLCTFQRVVIKWYTVLRCDWAYLVDVQYDFRNYILSKGVIEKLNTKWFLLLGTILFSYYAIINPLKKVRPFI